ncbi:MAG: acyl-CoA thioesterase domain-containing protein [Mycobacteriaceae bacterium]
MPAQRGPEHQEGRALAAAGPGRAGVTDLAMLVDLAAGAALRAELGADRRLATTALDVQLLSPLPDLDQLVARATTSASDGRRGTAGVELLAGGAALGHAVVAFAVLGGGLPPVPWEQPSGTPDYVVAGAEDALDPAGRTALAQVRDAGALSWSEALLQGGCTRAGTSSTVLQPSPLMANRAGGVQGGVLVGLAVLAAAGSVENAGQLDAVHVDFAAAASVSTEISASVATLRHGRRSQLRRVDLHQDTEHEEKVLVAAATVALRTV